GEANDYVGKGMWGGKIILVPEGVERTHENVIMGNTCLYGAIGGELYAAGRAGERFGVRNSGAIAVIEGAGHHLCEYMTGGIILSLGEVGYNVGGGMTGGHAYILDERDTLASRLNYSYVYARRLVGDEEVEELRSLIEKHLSYTGSPRAEEVLDNFDHFLGKFWKVIPIEQRDNDPYRESALREVEILGR
ncbi:MAG TPA: glutamate synthase subunit alpha, partial [Aquifex aeolicus]|nr:glutamate synthase subunit alpha [Aquifex aeolicus]